MQEVREYLLKEKLPVPSPDAIPELARRLGADPRFRADVASLLRAALYREREQIGFEDLLAILVAAAAGTEHDLKSESQEADIREMLRFVLQSRRPTFSADAERLSLELEPEPEPLASAAVISEPVREKRVQLAPDSTTRDTTQADAVPVAQIDRRESSDVVLPFRTTGLFAAHVEPEAARSRVHPVWIVGVVCLLLGVGLGVVLHRVVSAADAHHIALRAANGQSSQPVGARSAIPMAAANANVPPKPAVAAPQAAEQKEVKPVGEAGDLTGTAVPPGAPEKSSAVPMTVVRQVVTARPDPEDTEDDPPESTAATSSIVPRGLAGVMPAQVISSPPPEYPAAASAARVHGQVTVRAVVDPDGNVIYARAVSGPPLLREAAEAAVHRWRYSPQVSNGKPIAVTTTAILDFRFAK